MFKYKYIINAHVYIYVLFIKCSIIITMEQLVECLIRDVDRLTLLDKFGIYGISEFSYSPLFRSVQKLLSEESKQLVYECRLKHKACRKLFQN